MRRRLSAVETEKLPQDLGSLFQLSEEDLNDDFQRLYGVEPPARMRRSLLIRAIAYRLQEKALGGLKPATRRLLVSVGADAIARPVVDGAREGKVKPGTTLLREWHGVHYQLTVLEDGVRFGGKRYRSLSEVARKITGSRWSGPVRLVQIAGEAAAQRLCVVGINPCVVTGTADRDIELPVLPEHLDGEIPATCALFARLSGEIRKLKTHWRMRQSGANRSLSTAKRLTP
jgi:hypothetical protein